MNAFSAFASKLKYRRLWLTNNFSYGSIYHGSYMNWKTDPNPLVFIMYSDREYTQGINIHHLNYADKEWLKSLIASLAVKNDIINGFVLYQLIKNKRHSIIDTAYRKYFTRLLDLKLVSGGLSPELNSMAVSFSDSYIISLNNVLEGKERADQFYVPTEEQIQERIIQAQNTVDLRKGTVAGNRTAPWYRSTTPTAPWYRG